MGLIESIGDRPLAIDTSIFIYFLEDHPDFADQIAPIFERIDAGDIRATTSALTLLECLVVPFRDGNEILARKYDAILSRNRNLEVVPIDAPVLRLAAALRSRQKLRTPDAIHLASALASGSGVFLTADRRFPQQENLRIVVIARAAPRALRQPKF